jgi:hypothetical protein
MGARLSAPHLPTEGEELIFRAEKVQSFGRVIWSEGGQCGLEFDPPMVPAEVSRLREEASRWMGFGNSADETAAAEEWRLRAAR